MLYEFEGITIYRGATTIIELGFSEFDFKGGSVMFTVKDQRKNLIKAREIVSADVDANGVVFVEFTPEETKGMFASKYEFDLIHKLEDQLIPQCLPSRVTVQDTVGGVE